MGGVTIAVVEAFTSIEGTENAGMVAYYRAPGCTEVTIADVLPILSKINYYEDEYVIGEMLIWDTGEQSAEPNNCAMVRVIIYNDGWICAWLDKTTQNHLALGGGQYVDAQTLSGWGSTLEYEDRFNSYQLKITATTDPEVPVNTIFTIRNTDHVNGQIQVHTNTGTGYIFHTGYTYDVEIYTTNGVFLWWGRSSDTYALPSNMSNRLYRTIYQIWEEIKTSSNSTNWSLTDASLVYMYDSQTGVYTDETIDFNDVGTDDCQVLPIDEVMNDAFYIGSSNKFNGITITMGTSGIGSAITWEYYDGSAWSTLSAVDGSSGFTSTGELTFDPPDDWVVTLVNAQSYFWIRARVTTASYTTTPLLTRGQMYDQNAITYIDAELGMYNYEFTSSNYILVCGSVSRSLGSISDTKWVYYTILPSKVVYDAVISIGTHYTIGSPIYWSQELVVNGNRLIDNDGHSNGYKNRDLTSIDYTPGTQNVIELNTYAHYFNVPGCVVSAGVVLICS